MKFLSLLLLAVTLTINAQEKLYHVVTCSSESEGHIEILINNQQPNDQMLSVYSQAGLGPNSLEASYLSVGVTNKFAVDRNGSIHLTSNFSSDFKLKVEYSEAELKSNLDGTSSIYRNCRLK